MAGNWQVRARIGSDVFTQDRDLEEEPVLPSLYSVSWSHELDLDSEEAWPVPDALTTASVQLLMATAADAAAWDPTTVVHLEFLADGLTVSDSFSGRGSFPVIEPHDLGVLVTISVVSYLMDLDAYLTGGVAMPAEEVDARLNREVGFGLGGTWMDLVARDPNPVSILTLARDTLGYGAVEAGFGPTLHWELYQLTAEVDAAGDLDPLFPWGVAQLETDIYSPAPLQLRPNPDAPGTWELWADPDDVATQANVVDALEVEFNARWSRGIGRSVNTVHVVMADDTIQSASNWTEGAVVAYTVETELATPAEGLALAQLLLPAGDGEPSPWEADAFTVLLDHTPDGWYPPPLREVLALGRLERRHHPEGLTYFVGLVSRVEFSATQGTATVQVQLQSRRVLAPGAPTGITIDDVPQDIDTLTDTIDSFVNARP